MSKYSNSNKYYEKENVYGVNNKIKKIFNFFDSDSDDDFKSCTDFSKMTNKQKKIMDKYIDPKIEKAMNYCDNKNRLLSNLFEEKYGSKNNIILTNNFNNEENLELINKKIEQLTCYVDEKLKQHDEKITQQINEKITQQINEKIKQLEKKMTNEFEQKLKQSEKQQNNQILKHFDEGFNIKSKQLNKKINDYFDKLYLQNENRVKESDKLHEQVKKLVNSLKKNK